MNNGVLRIHQTPTGVMKMIYTAKIYRLDRRCLTGLRFVTSVDFDCEDVAAMQREVIGLRVAGYPDDKFRIDYAPKFKTVTNLITGKEVQIATDTPRCCDPSSELYWSM